MESSGRAVFLATAVVLLANVVGRLLGFLRDLVIASYFGASAQTDAFMVAWTIPESVSTLIMEGAMVGVLLPLFARELEFTGTVKGLVSRSILPVTGALLLLTCAAVLLARPLVGLLAPGLEDPQLAAQLVRVTSTTIFFMGLAGYVTAALNARHVFAIPAAVFAAYNVGILASILLFEGRLGIQSAAIGLAVGSALMVAVQLPTFLRAGGLARPSLKLDRTMLVQFAAFVPVGVFTLARQAQVYVERYLGSFLDAGAISHLNYASKVGQVPMSLAVTVTVVTFPIIARAAAAGETEELRRVMDKDLRLVALAVLPAAATLVVFAPQVVELLFERDAFTPGDTRATASILRVYALGLLAQALVWPAARPFLTRRASIWVPVYAGTGGLVATVVAAVVLLRPFGVEGLAAANALGISFMAVVLVCCLPRYVVDVDLGRLWRFLALGSAAAAVAAACASPVAFLGDRFGLPTVVELAFGTGIVAGVCVLLGFAARVEELRQLRDGIAGWMRGRP